MNNYRFIQYGTTMVLAILFFVGAYFASFGQWAAWAVASVFGIFLVIMAYRAAKLEVLTNLRITTATYEAAVRRDNERRGRR